MRALNPGLQRLAFTVGHFALPVPRENFPPIFTHQRYELWRRVELQILLPSVHRSVTQGLDEHIGWSAIPRHDNCYRRGGAPARSEARQHFGVLFELRVQGCVRGGGLRFHIDEEDESRTAAEHATPVVPHALAQRLQVKGGERTFHLHILAVMRDQQSPVHQVYIGLDAAETTIQRIEQRPGVLIVIVGMRANQGRRIGERCRNQAEHEKRKERTHSFICSEFCRTSRRARKSLGIRGELRADVRMRVLIPLVFACLVAGPLGAAHQDRHVVLVTIDGFPSRSWHDPALPIPNLRKLAAAGASADAMTVSNPSITWPCHTTLITGVTSQRHGVLFNGLLIRPETGKPPRLEPWVDKSKLVFVPTLYDVAHAAGLTTAESDWVAVTRPGTINWSFAEIPNPDGPVEQAMIAAGLITAAQIAGMQPGAGRNKTVWRDEMWTKAAIFMFKQYKPNLLLYHTLNTDAIHHRYGPGTDPGYTALAFADRLLGDLVQAVDESGLRARTTFIVTTDHGFKKVVNFSYPNVVLKKAGLVKTAGPTVTQCDAYVMTQGGIAFVYVLDPGRKTELLPRLKEMFAAAEGVERVIDAAGAHALGLPTPAENQGMGELILYPKNGYSFMASPAGDLVSGPAVNYGGSHGYFNGDPELDGIFVASGAGIKPGVRLDRVRNIDVAPTIAQLLGLKLPPPDGRVLEEILLTAK